MNLFDRINTGFASITAMPDWALLLSKVTLFLAIAWLVHFLLSRFNPRFRVLHWRGVTIGLIVLLTWGLALPAIEIPVSAPETTAVVLVDSPPIAGIENVLTDFQESENFQNFQNMELAPVVTQTVQVTEKSRGSVPWHVIVWGGWCFGVLFLLTRLGIGLLRLKFLLKDSLLAADEIVALAQQIGCDLGYDQSVQIRISSRFSVPILYGFWRPMMILPERMCELSFRDQLPAILAHELTHAGSWDVLWNAIVHLMRTLLWFHPLAWKICEAHRAACDAVCDAVSANYLGDVQAYCRTLASVALEANKIGFIGVLCMANRCDVRRRIAALQRVIYANRLRKRTIISLTCIALLTTSFLASVQLTPIVGQEESSPDPKNNQAVEVAKPPAETTVPAVKTEFIINDKKGKAIPAGTIKLTGHTDQGHYFSSTIPIKQGRAVMKFKRPDLTKFTLEIRAPNFQNYFRKYEPKKTNRTFAVARQYTYQLRNAITIGGTVIDDKGHPLKDVRVYYYRPSQSRIEDGFHSSGGWVTTGADGKWSTSNMPFDLSHLTLGFHLAWYENKKSVNRWSQGSQVTVFHKDFEKLRAQTYKQVLHKIPTVEGSVVTPQGKPIENVIVRYSGWDSGLRRERLARGDVIKTDEKGKFRIPQPRYVMRSRLANLQEKLQLTFQHPHWAFQKYTQAIPLTEPIHVVLQKGKRIEFLAIDTEGNPIKGMTFMPATIIPEFRGKTDADGRWVWENGPDEILSYQIISSTYLCQPPGSDFGPADSPITLKFRKTIPVSGTVVDDETGKPIPEFRLYEGTHFKVNKPETWSWDQETSQKLRPVKGSWAEGLVDNQSGPFIKSGRFMTRLSALDRLIRYRIQADGYLPKVSPILDAAKLPDEPVKMEFRLKKVPASQPAIITIMTPAGKPALNAQVSIKMSSKNGSTTLRINNGFPDQAGYAAPSTIIKTNSKGQFMLPKQDCLFVCVITHQEGYLEVKDTDLAVQRELKLKPWAVIEGTIFIKGKPAAGLEISCRDMQFYSSDSETFPSIYYFQSGVTDQTGKYRFNKGVSGISELNVRLNAPDENAVTTSKRSSSFPLWSYSGFVELASGKTIQKDIGQTGVDVIGRISIPADADIDFKLKNIQLSYRLADKKYKSNFPNIYQTRLSENGDFRFYNLPPGKYKAALVLGKAASTNKEYINLSIHLTKDDFLKAKPGQPIDLGNITVGPAKQ